MYYGEWSCCNYRTFYGEVSIPLFNFENDSEIVLIQGNNGFGKTTFINGIKLALYGEEAGLNKELSYKQYLKENINYKAVDDGVTKAWIAIKLIDGINYSGDKSIKEITIKREWCLIAQTDVEEYITIYENGKEIDIEIGYNEYVSKIIPKEMLNFFAYNTEENRYTADDFRVGENLTADISRILGITELEVSESALKVYQSKQMKEESLDSIDSDIIESQLKINSFKNIIKASEYSLNELESKAKDINSQIDGGKKWLTERGFFDNSIRLESERRIEILEQESEDIVNFYGNLKPGVFEYILLLPELKELADQLKNEDIYINKISNDNNEIKIIDILIDKLDEIKGEIELTENQVFIIKNTIEEAWEIFIKKELNCSLKNIFRYTLSYIDFNLLKDKVNRFIYIIEEERELLIIKRDKLDEIELEKKKLNNRIRNLPSNERIEKYKNEIENYESEKKKIIDDIQSEKVKINEYLRLIESEELTSRKLQSDLKQRNLMYEKVSLSQRVIKILEAYTKNLKKDKAKEIENSLEGIYQMLSNKDGMIRKFLIDEKTFEITIKGRYGQEVFRRSFSEGEKQIYGLSVTYALAKASKKEFGFIIDTPFAKLDTIHKGNVINKFIPKIGSQVIILAQDGELDGQYLDEVRKYCTKEYNFESDEENNTKLLEMGEVI